MLEDLSQHILDIAENSLNARASEIRITLSEDTVSGWLILEIEDNGSGMDDETLIRVVDPFTTSRTTRRVGLGLPFLKQSSELCSGEFCIASLKGHGTLVKASFRLDSIDRPPLGDIPSTLVSLLVGHPMITWSYEHKFNDETFSLNSQDIIEILGEPEMLRTPDIALWLKDFIKENLNAIRGGNPFN